MAAGGSSSDAAAGRKHRLEDTEYIEQSREIVDNVKSAVTVGKSIVPSPPSSSVSDDTPLSHAEEEKEGEDEPQSPRGGVLQRRLYRGRGGG